MRALCGFCRHITQAHLHVMGFGMTFNQLSSAQGIWFWSLTDQSAAIHVVTTL